MALSDRLLKDPIGSVLGITASQMNKFRWSRNIKLFEINPVVICKCHRFQCLSSLLLTKVCLEQDTT